MTIAAAEFIVLLLALYALIGALVSLAVVTVAGGRIDDNLKSRAGAPLQARALIFWGVAGLWPVFAWKLIVGEKPA